MTPWYILLLPLLSLVIRLVLERRFTWTLAENLLLLASTNYTDLSWTTLLVVVAIFIASAFWQTQLEYFDSAQDTDLHAAPIGCPAKIWNSGYPAYTIRHQTKDSKYCTPPEAQVPSINGNPETKKALHGRVTMFACDLRHLRRSGFKDDYHHSYLYVGYPVGLRACYTPLVTVEPHIKPGSLLPIKKAWFSIRPEDHALNGGANLSMAQKLEEFLLSEGEDPAEWPYAYLLTPPSVTWQLNNPLAFWYLYNTERELTAMIVQLQTSYGERRLWLTRNCRTDTLGNGPYCFRGRFKKDLQVSPFTPIAASYVIDSSDPCAAPLDRLKIMVTLKQGNRTVMHAVVNSTGPPLDVATAGLVSSVTFLLKWWWVPMCSVVVFRILFKAAKIYLTHNEKELNIQTRAEPTTTAIAKSARISERTLEKYFSMILSSMVSSQSRIKSVKYITSGEHCARTRVMHSHQYHFDQKGPHGPVKDANKESREQIVFQVNTPTFYSRFFHYGSPFAAIQSELLDDERTRTVWSSHPREFAALFPRDTTDTWREPLDWRWRMISFLRTAPTKTNFPRCTAYESCRGTSLTDFLVMQQCSKDQLRNYKRALIRLFLGHWIGGLPIGSTKEGDFELIGLSRDAILMIYEASLKVGLVISAIFFVGKSAIEPANIAYLLFAMLSMASLNIWACLKSIL